MLRFARPKDNHSETLWLNLKCFWLHCFLLSFSLSRIICLSLLHWPQRLLSLEVQITSGSAGIRLAQGMHIYVSRSFPDWCFHVLCSASIYNLALALFRNINRVTRWMSISTRCGAHTSVYSLVKNAVSSGCDMATNQVMNNKLRRT